MNPLKLLKPSYLLDPTPSYTFMYLWPLVTLFVLSFVGSFFLKKKFEKLPEHIPGRIREFTLLGLVLTFLRDQNIPYLAMRVWILVFFALIAVYAVWSWRDFHKNEEELKNRSKQKEVKDKYLPRPSKSKKKKRRR